MAINIDKTTRVLKMNERLIKGEYLVKSIIKNEFDIPSKTFDRDIKYLRSYYFQTNQEIIYDKKKDVYYLQSESNRMTKKEIYVLCKILIESRAFNNFEFNSLLEKLLFQCNENDRKEISKLIGNQRYNYSELQHGRDLINEIWEITNYIQKQEIIEINYKRQDGEIKNHVLKPVGIVFSEFYFYLLAYRPNINIEGPTIYRVDRIRKISAQGEGFSIPYNERFNESDFYNRVQFMYSGKLKEVRFRYTGVLEALIDRLPGAIIERETKKGEWIVRVESFGEGLTMWLSSQGDRVEIL